MKDELRDAIRKLCERYPDKYWQSLDRERAYPEKFVGELTDAGFLACMIPEEFGGPGLGIREAAVILEDGRVLLVHRLKGTAEYWVLPGGSIEIGASPEQACCREAKEETGLDIHIVRQLLECSNDGRDESWFLATHTGGELKLGEPELSRQSVSNRYLLEWIGPAEFADVNFQPEQLKSTIAKHLSWVTRDS